MEPFENIQHIIAGWIAENTLDIIADPLVKRGERHNKYLCMVSK
jgi:hypothetical protein